MRTISRRGAVQAFAGLSILAVPVGCLPPRSPAEARNGNMPPNATKAAGGPPLREDGGSAVGATAPLPPRVDVLVVGAGVGGLRAASLLRDRGADVHVVEATARVGGRISTRQSASGASFELGAPALQGARIIALCNEMGIQASPQRVDGGGAVWSRSGAVELFDGSVRVDVAEFTGAFLRVLRVCVRCPTVSADRAFDLAGSAPWVRRLVGRMLAARFGARTSTAPAGFIAKTVRAEADTLHMLADGVPALRPVGGCSRLVEVLAGRVSDRLHLSHELRELASSSGGVRAVVTTAEGVRSVDARVVVLCLSLDAFAGLLPRVAPSLVPPAVRERVARAPIATVTRIVVPNAAGSVAVVGREAVDLVWSDGEALYMHAARPLGLANAERHLRAVAPALAVPDVSEWQGVTWGVDRHAGALTCPVTAPVAQKLTEALAHCHDALRVVGDFASPTAYGPDGYGTMEAAVAAAERAVAQIMGK